MNPWRWVDPRIREVRLDALRAYLQSRGWREKPVPRPGLVCYETPAQANGQTRPTFTLSGPEDAPDYLMSLTYFLTTLSEIENRHPVAILDELLQCSLAPQATSPVQ
jgi:hypothetical protein